jgi:hypothetical protein
MSRRISEPKKQEEDKEIPGADNKKMNIQIKKQ